MPSIKCNRCDMTFKILDIPHDGKKSTVCAVKNCTRSFSSKGMGNRPNCKIKIYQTSINVTNTVNAAKYRKEQGLPVDNGGSQDFLNI